MTTNPRIKDMAAKDRPRERLAAEGADALSDAELVAILLRTGMQGYSAIHIAQQLLARSALWRNWPGRPWRICGR